MEFNISEVENEVIDLTSCEDMNDDEHKATIHRFHKESESIPQDIDYRKQMFERYENVEIEEDADDSFVTEEHKLLLFKQCKEIANEHYKQYPSPMFEILIKKLYNDAIRKTDKETYFREKEELEKKSVVEIELSKICKLSGM